jgi:hypothetical protein
VRHTGPEPVLAARMCAQGLTSRPHRTVVAVAAHTAGLQAQDTAATRLGVRARSATLTATAVRQACGEPGCVVRTWLMRGTLHLVAATDVRWMLGLFGARNIAGGARRRAQLGLDDETCARALAAIPPILHAESPLSRAELIDRLVRRGVPVDPRGQAPAHLIGYAAAHGVLCRGPDLDRDEPGYVLLDEWVPATPELDADAALAELTRRYLGAFGPAGPADLATWSGLPVGTARRGFGLVADELAECAPGDYLLAGTGRPAPTPGPTVRLLGAFDTYLLGYRDRAPMLPAQFASRIQAGGGIIHPAVLVDGRVVGTWRLRRAGETRPARAAIELFEPLARAVTDSLEEEVSDLGRFLDLPVVMES